jgi:hypothetical protein
MSKYNWTTQFEAVYEKAINLYSKGTRGAENYFNPQEEQFLASIGCTAQELYDFAEDAISYDEPDFGTTLLVTAARRDYFLYAQNGKPSGKVVATSTLKTKTDAVDGIEWLPRLIQKARLKLHGELDKDLMFCCGGDRKFFQQFDIAPADFLRFVWAAKEDDRKIIDWVKSRAK